jgi:TPP-dependent trihydroxycyclohexane-1,2-dione (THcHDO) dehydratase
MWWDVEVAEVSSNPEARDLRAAYERDRRRQQRFHY